MNNWLNNEGQNIPPGSDIDDDPSFYSGTTKGSRKRYKHPVRLDNVAGREMSMKEIFPDYQERIKADLDREQEAINNWKF